MYFDCILKGMNASFLENANAIIDWIRVQENIDVKY